MKTILVILTAVAALATATTVQAAPTAACSSPGSVTVTYRSFKMLLTENVHIPGPAITNPFCGSTPTAVQAATAAYTHEQRFYALWMSFPKQPTRAQWAARWKPMLQQAVAADTALIAAVQALMRDSLAMGIRSNPDSRAAYSIPNLIADRAWLVAHENLAFGKPVV